MASTKKSLKRAKTRNAGLLALIFIVIAIASAIFFSQPKRLDYVEITEYQGERLSSINDFRENSIKGPQNINISSYSLSVDGLVSKSRSFSYGDIINGYEKYEKVVTLNCVEGWSVTLMWEGILLKDMLNDVGVSQNATTVIFYAYDGYTTSLPLSYIIENNIMIAYKMNGVVLPPERGFPFQLVAESKLGYKWIKWITRIELSDNENYRGFWESLGYSNEADVS